MKHVFVVDTKDYVISQVVLDKITSYMEDITSAYGAKLFLYVLTPTKASLH